MLNMDWFVLFICVAIGWAAVWSALMLAKRGFATGFVKIKQRKAVS